MKARQTPTVAPVYSKATQILGTNVEPKKIRKTKKPVIRAKRRLSWTRAAAFGYRSPSTLRRSEKCNRGKTNMM
jgi:hypothetical protein